MDEAVEWLSYTYLFVRMRANPLVYGINYADVQDDPQLIGKRRELIHAVAKALDRAKMIRYNSETKDLNVTGLLKYEINLYSPLGRFFELFLNFFYQIWEGLRVIFTSNTTQLKFLMIK